MNAEDKVKKLVKELQSAQVHYGDLAQDYHMLAILPVMNDEAMISAMDYYTVMVMGFLKFMADFRKYYSGRSAVNTAYVRNLLKMADEIEKMLDSPTVDLGYLDDYGETE